MRGATIATALVLVTGVGVACCSRKADLGARAGSPGGTMTALRHANGLALRVPEKTYDVKETATGFRLSPVGSATRRTPVEVAVELRAGPQPTGAFPESRVVRAGRSFRYRVDVEDGGSSGDEHVLRGWSAAGDRHVWIEQGSAVEPPAKPDFAAAWQIADGVDAPAP